MSSPNFSKIVEMPPGDFTFGLIKPGVQFDVVAEIYQMIQDGGMELHTLPPTVMSSGDVRRLYYEHIGKHFYARNEAYLMSGPSVRMLIVGMGAQPLWRQFLMPTIREKFVAKWTAPDQQHLNLVHGSDSALSALREVALLWPFPGRWT